MIPLHPINLPLLLPCSWLFRCLQGDAGASFWDISAAGRRE